MMYIISPYSSFQVSKKHSVYYTRIIYESKKIFFYEYCYLVQVFNTFGSLMYWDLSSNRIGRERHTLYEINLSQFEIGSLWPC